MSNNVIVDFNQAKDRFEIQTPFLSNAIAKAIPSRKWNKAARKWFAPRVRKNVEFIHRNILAMSSASATQAALDAIKETQDKQQSIAQLAIPAWYPSVMPMRSYQKKCCDQFYGMTAGALFQKQGVGKSKTVIDILSAKAMTPGPLRLDAILICCPFSIRSNWIKQFAEHCPLSHKAVILNHATVAGRAAYEDLLAEKEKLRVLIVGIASLSSGQASKFTKRFVMSTRAGMVVDESSTIKNPRANRTKAIVSIGKSAAARFILTGTPVTQGILDLYAQFEFLDRDIIGAGDFYSFRNMYAVMGGYDNKEVIGYQHVEELMSSIRPYVNQVGAEALAELPPKTYTTRYVEMSAQQRSAYKSLSETGVFRCGEDAISVSNALEKLLRLQQVTGGFGAVVSEDPISGLNVYKSVPVSSAKANEVIAIAEETDESIVVFCRFRPEIALVVAKLSERYGPESVVECHGGIEDKDRWASVTRFQDGSARFFVANQATASMGFDLFKGSISVFYSNSFSYQDRDQSEARIHRIGQVNPCLYVDLVVKDTVDEAVVRILSGKGDVAAYVTAELRKGNNPLDQLAAGILGKGDTDDYS